MLIYVAIASLLGCLLSQLLKLFFSYIVDGKKLKLRNMTCDGDYPSSHTSFITCVTTLSWMYTLNRYLEKGNAEIEMWISVSLTALMAVIIRDALGVRLTVQKLCESVIKLTNTGNLEDSQIIEEIRNTLNLKSGHKPYEVVGGAILGIMVAIMASAVYYHWHICIAIMAIIFLLYVFLSILFLKSKRRKKR